MYRRNFYLDLFYLLLRDPQLLAFNNGVQSFIQFNKGVTIPKNVHKIKGILISKILEHHVYCITINLTILRLIFLFY